MLYPSGRSLLSGLSPLEGHGRLRSGYNGIQALQSSRSRYDQARGQAPPDANCAAIPDGYGGADGTRTYTTSGRNPAETRMIVSACPREALRLTLRATCPSPVDGPRQLPFLGSTGSGTATRVAFRPPGRGTRPGSVPRDIPRTAATASAKTAPFGASPVETTASAGGALR